MRRQKQFADRAEQSLRRLQAEGKADPDVDPAIAAVALGAMVGRFAELWLVVEWDTYDFDSAVDQVTRLWANAIGLREIGTPPAKSAKKPAAKKPQADQPAATKTPTTTQAPTQPNHHHPTLL